MKTLRCFTSFACKLLLLTLLAIPFAGSAQFRTDVVYEHPKRLYAKLGGGYNFPDKKESGAIALASAGLRTTGFFAAGIGAGYFKLPGYDGHLVPVGLDLNFFDMNQKFSPVLNINAAYPFENMKDIKGKSFLSGGIGFSYMGESRQGGILTVNYAVMGMSKEYAPGLRENINEKMIFVALHVLL